MKIPAVLPVLLALGAVPPPAGAAGLPAGLFPDGAPRETAARHAAAFLGAAERSAARAGSGEASSAARAAAEDLARYGELRGELGAAAARAGGDGFRANLYEFAGEGTGGAAPGEAAAGAGEAAACAVVHDFRIVPPVYAPSGFNYGGCGPGHGANCLEFWLGNRADDSLTGDCAVFEETAEIVAERPGAVESFVLDTLYFDDYIQLLIKAEDAATGAATPWVKVLNLPGAEFPPETEGKCELGESRAVKAERDLWPLIAALASTLPGGGPGDGGLRIALKQRVSVTGAGEGYMNFRLTYRPAETIRYESWADGGCLARLAEEGGTLAASCLAYAGEPDGGECALTGGIRICRDHFRMPDAYARYPALAELWDPLCLRQVVRRADPEPEEGGERYDRWFARAADGSPRRAAAADLLADAGKAGIAVREAPGGGRTFAAETEGVPDAAAGEKFFPAGAEALAGYGTEEPDAGFAEAAALLQVLEFAQDDVTCAGDGGGPRTCRVFRGETASCRNGYFGEMNCCEAPNTADAATYVKMISYLAAIKTALATLRGASPLSWGAFDGALPAGGGLLAGAADTVVGKAVGSFAAGAAEDFARRLTLKLADLVGETMGEAAKEAMFTETVGEEGIAALEINPAILGAMQGVLAAYVAYRLAETLKEIVTSCRPAEVRTSIKLKLGSCVYAGRRCTRRILGECLEYTNDYCCFNSPLARVVMGQIAPGGAGCAGLGLDELAGADLSGLDLSEWTDMLKSAGALPEPGASLGELTGEKHPLNAGDRQGAAERNAARLADLR